MAKRIVVVASGRGSNFQAVIGALQRGSIPVECVALVTDNPKAYAIERAQAAGIPVVVVDYALFASRGHYEQALLKRSGMPGPILSCSPGICVSSGKRSDWGICREDDHIHPCALTVFPGLHAQRQALLHGVKVTGCTVHFVDESLDGGPIILQRCVRVMDDDDEDTLANRILIQEHIALPEAVRSSARTT